MQDRPTAVELLEAVERFLEKDVVPVLQGPKQYHARVAANVMRILAREITLEEGHARAEWQRLGRLLGEESPAPQTLAVVAQEVRRRNETLCARIRHGDADAGPWRGEVLAHGRRTVEEKLAVAKPEMNQGQL